MARVLQQYKVLHYIRKPIRKLRQRISLPCLRLMFSRLSEIDPIEHIEKYDQLRKYQFTGVIPGHNALQHTYWLYPVIFREPKKIIVACRFRGIQALAGKEVHWLASGEKEDDQDSDKIPEAKRILENIVLLPINIETSELNIQKVKSEVVDSVNALNRGLQILPIRIFAKL